MSKTIHFLIDHLDPLGQGVSRRTNPNKQNTLTFIPKTLPGEQGSAAVIKSSKGVEFAELTELTQRSPQRIESECVHYAECSGCDYLHVSYADELSYKKKSLVFLLRSFQINNEDIELIAAPQRFGYRNRVQLHYRHKYIGLVDANADRILEVPQCRLLHKDLLPAFHQLYQDKAWAKERSVAGKLSNGHCEISLKNQQPHIEWDAPYASGGFTQVNDVMNEKLREWLKTRFAKEAFASVLDLFSGNGNLSDTLLSSVEQKRMMVDSSPLQHPDFVRLDLLADDALGRFKQYKKEKSFDVLLLDPPRKGFPALTDWVGQYKPRWIVYVSCNPATLARDLQGLLKSHKKIQINHVMLLDMFPATRHFETVVVLKNSS